MTVSVIIPTYNGAHRILNIIKSLETQTFQDFETVVVIDGSTDHTKEIIQEYKTKLKGLRIVQRENGGRAKVRNTGARVAKGDLFIFYDDDMRPQPDSIRKHLDLHLKYKNSLCGGNQLEDYNKIKTDIQQYKASLSRKWISNYKSGLNKLDKSNLFLTAANFSIPKNIFRQLGGFNESLSDAEDHELGCRASIKGVNIFFDKGNVAWHDDLITCKKYIFRQRQYKKANQVLKQFLPKEYSRNELDQEILPFHKKFIYYIFSNSFWVRNIDHNGLVWLPKKLRYGIYDLVITSLGKIYINKTIA